MCGCHTPIQSVSEGGNRSPWWSLRVNGQHWFGGIVTDIPVARMLQYDATDGATQRSTIVTRHRNTKSRFTGCVLFDDYSRGNCQTEYSSRGGPASLANQRAYRRAIVRNRIPRHNTSSAVRALRPMNDAPQSVDHVCLSPSPFGRGPG